ncbi:hypothetical protein DIPPA_29631 [Diplonema papillatum]|nr:hypothetical protein DIPPA_29631 [Diplonema papillatum]
MLDPDSTGMQAEVYRRLSSVRQNISTRMEGAERSLLEDIEVAGVLKDWTDEVVGAGRPRLTVTELIEGPVRARAGADAACNRCGLSVVSAAFCPLTGERHDGAAAEPPVRFGEARRGLLASAGPEERMQLSPRRAGGLDVGDYCVIKNEFDVRRLCSHSNAPWHDGMERYCGGVAVGRVAFSKPTCSVVDVTFPTGESWLFPAGAVSSYRFPQDLASLDEYPSPERGDSPQHDRDDRFIQSLQHKLRERELLNRVSELQMRYIEAYIAIYNEEKRARRKLTAALKDLRQITQLRRRPGHAPYPLPYANPAAAHPSYMPYGPVCVNRLPPAMPAGPVPLPEPGAKPLQAHFGEVPWNAQGGGWDVVGVTPEGLYVYKEAFTSRPASSAALLDAMPEEAPRSQRTRQDPFYMPPNIMQKSAIL